MLMSWQKNENRHVNAEYKHDQLNLISQNF